MWVNGTKIALYAFWWNDTADESNENSRISKSAFPAIESKKHHQNRLNS